MLHASAVGQTVLAGAAYQPMTLPNSKEKPFVLGSLDVLTETCAERIQKKHELIAMMVFGSAARQRERPHDVDFCAIARNQVMERAFIFVGDVPVDLFIYGLETSRVEIRNARHQHVVKMFADGQHVWGDSSVSQELQRAANDRLARPAPAPSPLSAFAFRSRPYSLLRKFRDIRAADSILAGIIATELIQCSIDAFFALNRIWNFGFRERVTAIAQHSPDAAAALQRVISASPSALRGRVELLEDMVRYLVGHESREEAWFPWHPNH